MALEYKNYEVQITDIKWDLPDFLSHLGTGQLPKSIPLSFQASDISEAYEISMDLIADETGFYPDGFALTITGVYEI